MTVQPAALTNILSPIDLNPVVGLLTSQQSVERLCFELGARWGWSHYA